MGAYILRRLLLIVPTLFGILLDQLPPGAVHARRPGRAGDRRARRTDVAPPTASPAAAAEAAAGGGTSEYRGAQGLPPEFIAELEQQFGFDKPAWQRFLLMLGNYLTFNFGESYFRSISVVDLVLEKMPVSITLGLWSTLLAYLISIPLGIRKAIRDGSRFDTGPSGAIIVAYADPVLPLRRSCCSCSSPAAPTGESSRCAASPPTTGQDLSLWSARSSTTSGTSPCR